MCVGGGSDFHYQTIPDANLLIHGIAFAGNKTSFEFLFFEMSFILLLVFL